MKHGKHTADFGKKLRQYYRTHSPSIDIWYDHGDAETDCHVLKTQGFYNSKPSRLTNLAEVDIMITKNKEILFLIEIEETQSSPKKLLGDALALLMCNGFAIKPSNKHKIFRPSEQTKVLIASWFNPKGKGSEKMKRFQKRFQEMSSFKQGINVSNVTFIHAVDIQQLISNIDSILKQII